MLLSRFWYALLALALGASLFTLYVAQSMYNRTGSRAIAEGLSSDSQMVSWYVRATSRERAAQLITFSLNPDVVQALSQASGKPDAVPKAARDKANAAVAKLAQKLPQDSGFDAVFAVDQHGRVVGRFGYDQAANSPDFQLGSYPVVADALHGVIRDDIFVWDRMYAVVARPVEMMAGELPVGAIVGLQWVDDAFARDIAARTGAAVAFYVSGERTAAAAPTGFDKSQLDGIVSDVKHVTEDADYNAKGRSSVRYLSPTVGVVYSRLHGEAWQRGAGYVVGRAAQVVATPFSFFSLADDKDKSSANFVLIGLLVALGSALGIAFTLFEHTRPLAQFQKGVAEFAAGKLDALQASKVSGQYRKIVTLIHDGVERTAATGGGGRRAADLGQVLGDLPAQPAMGAFSFPDAGAVSPVAQKPIPAPLPQQPGAIPGVPPRPPRAVGAPEPMAAAALVVDEVSEWRSVFEEFRATKRNCGEPTETLTYEKFEATLKKTREGIVSKHGVSRVKFSVYVKDGKAALKANPVRD